MTLSNDARAVWQAGVDAVNSSRLLRNAVRLTPDELTVGSSSVPLSGLNHIEVVGAGKAGAGMVRGLLNALADLPGDISLSGWVNVPADCVADTEPITLHAARPAGVNEPRPEGVTGTQEILRRVRRLNEQDLCIVLLSGGGSALLPAPVDGVSLDDKLAVTRLLAASGATIQELNIVRSQLSSIKGGGFLRHCRAGKLIGLVISDVVGDPLESIASGPTVPPVHSPDDARHVLSRCHQVPATVAHYLQTASVANETGTCDFMNEIIGSNDVARQAAAHEARRLGYHVIDLGSQNTGEAATHGVTLLRRLQQERDKAARPVCLLAGGETTVTLNPSAMAQKGGRNQEAVLAAVTHQPEPDAWSDLALLSGGTDGEDGPTDAAGALADAALVGRMASLQLAPMGFLRDNNSYPFFDRLDGLIKTGPTHTNVMDLAVGIAG